MTTAATYDAPHSARELVAGGATASFDDLELAIRIGSAAFLDEVLTPQVLTNLEPSARARLAELAEAAGLADLTQAITTSP